MSDLNRRDFTKIMGAAGTVAAGASLFANVAYAQGKGKLVVVGGGAGGATVAHHVKKQAPNLDVTLVEGQKTYTSCFFSNLYLGGYRSFESITHDYEGLRKVGVNVVNDWATDVDAQKKTVTLKGGQTLSYDKLVLSPGIDIKYDSIEGYSPEVAKIMPHAWKAGVQTAILRRQLLDMPDGGVVVLTAPPNPFRCPPGPYERVSMIAHHLKHYKPRSKLLVLDPKPKFSKMALFQEGWQEHYTNIVEWLPPEMTGGGVKQVVANTMEVVSGDGERIKAAVANIVPPQRAGEIAHKAGCAKGDWCPIVPETFESRLVKHVHVLGDASIAKKMPKSAFSANSQAKVVVNAVLAEMTGKKKFPARFRNTCWSLISTNNGVKVGASYKAGAESVEVTSQFISKTGEDADLRQRTYEESIGWYSSITADVFAKA